MSKKTCLVEGCGDIVEAKGLCHVHYFMLYNRVKKGEFTWKELEGIGMAYTPDSTKKSLKKRKQLEADLKKKNK